MAHFGSSLDIVDFTRNRINKRTHFISISSEEQKKTVRKGHLFSCLSIHRDFVIGQANLILKAKKRLSSYSPVHFIQFFLIFCINYQLYPKFQRVMLLSFCFSLVTCTKFWAFNLSDFSTKFPDFSIKILTYGNPNISASLQPF